MLCDVLGSLARGGIGFTTKKGGNRVLLKEVTRAGIVNRGGH